jgi:hypothetical protein
MAKGRWRRLWLQGQWCSLESLLFKIMHINYNINLHKCQKSGLWVKK